MISGTLTQPTCSRRAFTPKSPASLGHSKVGITRFDLYSHVLPGMQDEAAMKVDAALRAAQKR